jgi:hypothetical protein
VTVHETVQETLQDTAETVQDTLQTTADRAADVLEETADRLRAHEDSGHRFPWRPLLLTAGIAGAALAVAQTLRRFRSHAAGPDRNGFPADLSGEIPLDEAQATIDRSVAAAEQAVTDITDNARSSTLDAG